MHIIVYMAPNSMGVVATYLSDLCNERLGVLVGSCEITPDIWELLQQDRDSPTHSHVLCGRTIPE